MKSFIAEESGAIALIMAAAMVVLMGIGALAIDVGYMSVVQNDLKKAAEAGALAGATVLAPVGYPNWSAGQAAAEDIVAQNYVAGQPLTDCQVNPGYWDLSNKTFDTNTAKEPSGSEAAGIRVVVGKSEGKNGGPLQLFFAPILGINTNKDLSASAVAIRPFPLGMPAGSLAPLAVLKSTVDQYWNSPESFKIGSSQGNDNGNGKGNGNGNGDLNEDTGQWTSFLENKNDANTIKGLIDSGNPDPLQVNDGIYIQPGVKASLYDEKNLGGLVQKTVVLPIVESLASKTTQKVQGFIAFYIEGYNKQGNDKYIEGHIDKNFNIPAAIKIGHQSLNISYSTPLPPKLVN